MRWEKLGLLYSPKGIHPKLATHAANPLAIWLDGDIYRVYYSGRDRHSRSSVSYIDVDIIKQKLCYIHDRPVFEFGQQSSFYSHGVSVGSCYSVKGRRYILFMGWHIPDQGHWRGEIGRLELKSNGELVLDSETPLLPVDGDDQISLSYPWVTSVPDGTYLMWYGSTVAWDAGNGEMLHVIKQARSFDGYHWERMGLAIPYELYRTQAFSRPTVVGNINEGYHMWFSYRSGSGESYRIGYARSNNLKEWESAIDEAGIDVSPSGWDSEMIEYPFVFRHNENTYMFYNGNDYGKTGIGIAVLV